uniref:Ig-like domain-containing protein n=1 Tax=Erpetoichthys calabaricus TaxID=27687 RepID=A0A8C4RGR9_ERPCA
MTLSFSFSGSFCQISVIQTPTAMSVIAGDCVTFTCIAISDVSTGISWYHQRPGEAPKLLIYETEFLADDTPSRFSGSGSDTEYTLMINGVEPEDAGNYYCMQYLEYSLTE